MKLFTHIKRSVYDPAFYDELADKPLSFSLKYIFSFGLIFALLIMVQFAVFTLPSFHANLQKVAPFVMDAYPADLVVTLEGGEISTNVEEPYVLPGVDGLMKDAWTHSEAPKHGVVIDTNVSPDVKYLEEYDTLILVTKEHILYQDERGKVTVQSLRDIPDGVLDKELVDQLVLDNAPYIYWLIPLAFMGLFIFAFLYIAYHLVYLLLAALFIMLVAKTRNRSLTYGKAYQAGVHLLTLPMVFVWFAPVSFPFMFTLMVLVLAAMNIERREVTTSTPPTT